MMIFRVLVAPFSIPMMKFHTRENRAYHRPFGTTQRILKHVQGRSLSVLAFKNKLLSQESKSLHACMPGTVKGEALISKPRTCQEESHRVYALQGA